MSQSIDTSRNRPAFSVSALAGKLFATLFSLVMLIGIVVFIIVTTLRITSIHFFALRILAGVADVALGTGLFLGGIYIAVRLFVRLLAERNIS